MNLKQALQIFNLESLDSIEKSDLKKLYRELAGKKHPDKKGGSEEEFVKLREAYLFLLTQEIKDKEEPAISSTELKELSKEEILNKYFHDTGDLQNKVNNYQLVTTNQIQTLDLVKKNAEEALQKFEDKKHELRKELEVALADLERKISPGLLQKLFLFFVPRMSEEEFWKRYQFQVQKFSRKDAELDAEFFKEMLQIYGNGLNNISNTLTEI